MGSSAKSNSATYDFDLETVSTEANVQLADLEDDFPGFVGAILATGDGHTAASRLPRAWDASDIAAMTASLTALAQSIADRTGMSPCRNVMVENEKGTIILLSVNEILTLACIGKTDASIGMQINAARKCSRELNERLSGALKRGIE